MEALSDGIEVPVCAEMKYVLTAFQANMVWPSGRSVSLLERILSLYLLYICLIPAYVSENPDDMRESSTGNFVVFKRRENGFTSTI